MYDEFSPRGVRFRLVYPNPLDSDEAIDNHLREYGYPSIAARDRDHALVKAAGATITPEAAVFDSRGRLVYLGRIDDRFVELWTRTSRSDATRPPQCAGCGDSQARRSPTRAPRLSDVSSLT